MEDFFCFFTVCLGLTVLAVSALAFHILSKRRSEQHTLFTTLAHYALEMLIMTYGWRLKRRLEKTSKNCSRVQEQALMEILRENADTVYGREYKLGEMNNKYEFVANHPLTFYEHYKRYMDRVADGEPKIMTVVPPLELATSSGTTGDIKLFVYEKKEDKLTIDTVILALYCLKAVCPQARSLQKGAMIVTTYVPQVSKAKGGLAITSGVPSPKSNPVYPFMYTTPLTAFDIPTEPEAFYVHLLFALKDRQLGFLFSLFAMQIYTALVAMETNWEDLVNDIKRGHIKENLQIPHFIKSDLDKRLSPDPKRADELRLEFLKGFDNTIVRRVWPHINFSMCTTTGSSAIYAKKLTEKYLDIPLFSPAYGATEGMIGVNIWPTKQEPVNVLIPWTHFFEFIPVENSDENQPKTLFAEEVQVGSLYEIVITNHAGLYRYRLGDVVKIVNFYNNLPVVQFQFRKGQLLNIHQEMTSEKVMYEALQATLNENYPSAGLVDYTCTESVILEGQNVKSDIKEGGETIAPFYVIFVEFSIQSDVTGMEVAHFEEKLDRNICDRNVKYESFRQRGGISKIQVHILKPGTFDKLIQFYHNRNPLVGSRFKLPRLTKAKEGLELLLSNAILRHEGN